jgi:hypothetical protein
MEDVKKNGSTLYLCKRPFSTSREVKDAPYLVPSICKTGDVKSSTNNDRTRIFPGRCASHLTLMLAYKRQGDSPLPATYPKNHPHLQSSP